MVWYKNCLDYSIGLVQYKCNNTCENGMGNSHKCNWGGFFSSLWTSIKTGVVSAMNAVIGGIESGINFIVRGINKIIGGFNKIVSWVAKVPEIDWGGVDTVPEVSFN